MSAAVHYRRDEMPRAADGLPRLITQCGKDVHFSRLTYFGLRIESNRRRIALRHTDAWGEVSCQRCRDCF